MSKKQSSTLKGCISLIKGQVKTQRISAGKYRVMSAGNKPLGSIRKVGNHWTMSIKGV